MRPDLFIVFVRYAIAIDVFEVVRSHQFYR